MGSTITNILQSLSLVANLQQTATNGTAALSNSSHGQVELILAGLSVLGTFKAPTLPDFLPGVSDTDAVYMQARLTSFSLFKMDSPGDQEQQQGLIHTKIRQPLVSLISKPAQGLLMVSARVVTRFEWTRTKFSLGVVRSYDFTLSRGYIAPDGVNKSVILINNQFPGGDTFSINVNNQITGPKEGTGLHWHGILQRATPWYDGVPSVQQCPIAPGKSLRYTFKADLFGTSWYHSHYSAQYAGGAFGAMIIHGPHENIFYDVDVGPVLLLIPAGGPACTPNAGISKFNFTSGKTHRLRLINAGAEGMQRFSIDNHTMKVIAQDFVPVRPFDTNIGQRTDVLVKANMAPNSTVFMRSNIPKKCSTANQPLAVAAIYYEKADRTKTPKSSAQTYDDSKCGNDDLTLTKPLFPFPALPDAATTLNLDITLRANASGNFLWHMNNVSFRANYDAPILLLSAAGNNSYPFSPQWNVYNFQSNSSVRLIVKNHFPALHPMHMHGHNFFVLAEGVGEWDGKITNYPSTTRRDVHIVQPARDANTPGYLVLQYDTDNPGVWPFHCHIAWHVSAGLYVNLMEHPDQIRQKTVPQTIVQTCRDWSVYSGTEVVDQIDSGL
ncbi:MAG: hypothetical protein Q9213_006997 [Squamulea squamosa]